MTSMLRAGGAAAMQGARRTRSGAVPPSGSISTPGDVQHGAVLTLTGSDYTSLQWLHAGSPISGETASTYTVDRADGVLDHGDITCEMTGPGGVVESNALVYEGADLPLAIFSPDHDVTVVSGEVDSIASSFGAFSCTITAPSSTQRPAYNATGGTGGRAQIETDGVDERLAGAITKGSAWADYEFGIVMERVDREESSAIWVGYYNTSSHRFSCQDSTTSINWRVSVQAGANVGLVFANGAPKHHYSGDADPSGSGTINARIDGTIQQGATASVTSRTDGGNIVFGGSNVDTLYSQIKAQQFYVGEFLTADERTDLRSLLTGLSGISS